MAVALAGGGCAATFFGAAELQARGPEAASLAPLLAGVAMIVALVIHQYRGRRPLMPVRQLAITFPVCGILVAMCASAAAFGLTELILTVLQGKGSPGHIALLFLPEFGAAVLTAVLFGALFRTRFTALLPIGGLVMLIVAAALLAGLYPKSADPDVLVAVSSRAPRSRLHCSSPGSRSVRRKSSVSSHWSSCCAASPRSWSRRSCCT